MEAEVANGQSGFTSVGRPKKRSSVLQKLLVKYIREIFETIDPYSAIGTDLSKRGVHPLQAGSVRPALVDRTGPGEPVRRNRLRQKTQRRRLIAMLREHEVKGLAVSIDRTIEVTPLAADLHIGLV